MKKKTSVNIEESLLRKAKKEGINISEFINTKLKTFLYGNKIPQLRKELVNKVSYCCMCKTRKSLDKIESTYFNTDKYYNSYCVECLESDVKEDWVKDISSYIKTVRDMQEYCSRDEDKNTKIILNGFEMVNFLLKKKLAEAQSTL